LLDEPILWSRRRWHLLIAVLASQSILPARAQAERWPARPVRYVVPYAPGGPTDTIGRLLATELSALWEQPVVVDNRPGANAVIGADFVSKSPADGYTLLQGTSSTHGTNPALFGRLPYDAQRDFVPVVPLVEGPVYLCVAPDSPWSSVSELLAHARAHPGEMNYGTAGPGSPQHLAGELLRNRAGVDVAAIHYKGAAPALLALARGDIAFYFDSTGVAQARAGRVRVLAVSTRWRWPLAPEVPTLVELGIPDFEIHGWFALFAPVGTPPSVVDRIQHDVNAVLARPEVRQRIEALGLRPLDGGGAELGARVRREARYWDELVRANHLRID
jgi:tripartite-type tricarboxylate transporter receptor subunit TctC